MRHLWRPAWAVFVVLVLLFAASPLHFGASQPPATAAPATDAARPLGAIASAEPAATEVGLGILRRGGNAVDAAVAVALALAVVHPQAGNLGGGGFAVVRHGGEIATLDFRETAPAAARKNMFRGTDGKPIEDASTVGPLAAGVPGSPAGLYELHHRYGRMSWQEVVAPSVALARDGFLVTPRLTAAVKVEAEELKRFPTSAALWLPNGEPPPAGTRLRQKDLAETLAAYGARGPKAIVSGPVARAVEKASREHGGILKAADLAAYRPIWRAPIRFKAFGWEFASMPLPASGGLILGESMLMLERLGWAQMPRDGAGRVHMMIEAWRRAYADRYLLGDPATSRADAPQLLDPAWIAKRASGIDPDRATPSADVRPWPDAAAEAASSEERRGETTHLSAADSEGTIVALTTTLNGWFGCYLLVPGAGFFLNNEMDDFATIPDQPNMYDLAQSEANAVAPGARMLSSMAPTIAWRGAEVLAAGSRGGSRIPTATMQVLLDVIVDGEATAEAVARPRLHHQWRPDDVVFEEGALPGDLRAVLEGHGYRFRATTWVIGEVDLVRVLATGAMEAVADTRGPGGAGVAVGGSAVANE